MDYGEVSNLKTLPKDHPIRPSSSRRDITHEIIFTIFSLIGIWADVLIVIIIVKFKRLRKVSLVLIGNWAFADLLSLIVTPSTYRIISVLEKLSMSWRFMCMMLNMGAILHHTVQLFAVLVLINWTFETYYPKGEAFMKKHYKYIIGIIWMSSFVRFAVNSSNCSIWAFDKIAIAYFLIFCTYCLTLLIIIVLQITRGIQKCRKRPLEKSTLMLRLVTAFVISWILGFVNTLCASLLFFNKIVLVLGACLIFSSSLINLSLLYFGNEEFKACFCQLIKCRENNYDEPDLNYENSVVQTNANSSVVITFPTVVNDEEKNKSVN